MDGLAEEWLLTLFVWVKIMFVDLLCEINIV